LLSRKAKLLFAFDAIIRFWHERKEKSMLDVIFILATLGFFGLSVLYVRGCERLK